MAHGGRTAPSSRGFDPSLVGAVLTRVGLAIVGLATPVAAGALAGLLLSGLYD
jgi:hypothetical protein